MNARATLEAVWFWLRAALARIASAPKKTPPEDTAKTLQFIADLALAAPQIE